MIIMFYNYRRNSQNYKKQLNIPNYHRHNPNMENYQRW